MDEADGVTAGSKRALEVDDDSKRASRSTIQTATEAANVFEDIQKSAPMMQNMMAHNLSGKLSGDRGKGAAAPQAETLMSYELVRHQVQRRLHVEKISTDAIHALVPDVEFRLFQLLQEADRFRRRCRRSKLLPEDINSACRMLNVEPLYPPALRLHRCSFALSVDNSVRADTDSAAAAHPLPKSLQKFILAAAATRHVPCSRLRMCLMPRCHPVPSNHRCELTGSLPTASSQ
jgi:hypothetical protein